MPAVNQKPFQIEQGYIYGLKPGINALDFEKIEKLTKREMGEAYQKHLHNTLQNFKFDSSKVKIDAFYGLFKTKKTQTEYVLCIVNGVQVAIQTRYIKIIGKITNHPLTDQFLPDFK